jgi:hypothetical protein
LGTAPLLPHRPAAGISHDGVPLSGPNSRPAPLGVGAAPCSPATIGRLRRSGVRGRTATQLPPGTQDLTNLILAAVTTPGLAGGAAPWQRLRSPCRRYWPTRSGQTSNWPRSAAMKDPEGRCCGPPNRYRGQAMAIAAITARHSAATDVATTAAIAMGLHLVTRQHG